MEICDILRWPKPSPSKRNTIRQNGCLRRPYKALRKEEKWKTKEKRKDIPIWMQRCSYLVQSLSCVQFLAIPWSAAHQPSLSPGVCSNSCPLSWWCHPIISSSVIPFSSCPQSFLASVSFPGSLHQVAKVLELQLQQSVLPINIQGWFPLVLTSLISLQSKGLSRVFSNTTVGKHQFFGAQSSLWSNSHIHTWLLEKP